ncbi:uncharacterized protein LOC142814415 [Rhipicephalus microplus]|uniref:uncharacterized protein LOC142814415 n=1 Tax=Rhipicephalus microplus TaxID=6941 RepID=UPI003F6D250A
MNEPRGSTASTAGSQSRSGSKTSASEPEVESSRNGGETTTKKLAARNLVFVAKGYIPAKATPASYVAINQCAAVHSQEKEASHHHRRHNGGTPSGTILSASLRSLRGRYERRVHQSRLHLLPQKRRIAPELLFLPPRFLCASSVVSGTLRGQGRRLLSELSHLPAKSITWHTSQSAQWSLAPYVVKAGGYCQSSLTFLRSPSPGTHHNQEIFQERMAACAPALFQMMEEAPTKHTMELVVRVRDEGQREKAVQVAVLPFLCAHFKEDKNYLYQVFEEGTSITEKLAELPSTPTIIALGINMLK